MMVGALSVVSVVMCHITGHEEQFGGLGLFAKFVVGVTCLGYGAAMVFGRRE